MLNCFKVLIIAAKIGITEISY